MHLVTALADASRQNSFDMDDDPESLMLSPFGKLHKALKQLECELGESYNHANTDAVDHQQSHQRLAKWAILSGCGAVGLAVIQLGIGKLFPSWTPVPLVLEIVAVLAGAVAVITGRKAKHDHEWLIKRHQSEKLRMLKFRSLGRRELWCGDFALWTDWLRTELQRILSINDRHALENAVKSEQAEPSEDHGSQCVESLAALRALARYYRRKRVDFQERYFRNRSLKCASLSQPLRHVGVPLFFASIIAVFIHVGFDVFDHFFSGSAAIPHHDQPSVHDAAKGGHTLAHLIAVLSLIVATLLPLISLSIRAWLGAFEHGRSSALFEAKAHALEHASKHISASEDNLTDTMHHIAHIEHFLDQEHREWLRLMLETEWFV